MSQCSFSAVSPTLKNALKLVRVEVVFLVGLVFVGPTFLKCKFGTNISPWEQIISSCAAIPGRGRRAHDAPSFHLHSTHSLQNFYGRQPFLSASTVSNAKRLTQQKRGKCCHSENTKFARRFQGGL